MGGGGGGGDSDHLKMEDCVIKISVRDAAEPQNLVSFPKI